MIFLRLTITLVGWEVVITLLMRRTSLTSSGMSTMVSLEAPHCCSSKLMCPPDSSVSRRQASSVITPSAYLLFYRRRSSEYLGPARLQKIVHGYRHPPEAEEVTDSAAEDESESRAVSPSGQGKGHRLGGSFLNGSPSASVAVGAGRLHRRGGDGSGAANQEARARTGNRQLNDGGYDADADEDEGVADVDVDVDVDTLVHGPELPPPYAQGSYTSWSFAGLPGLMEGGGARGGEEEHEAEASYMENDAEGDADSTTAVDGGYGSDDADMSGDETRGMVESGVFHFDSAHHPSPSGQILPTTEYDDEGVIGLRPLLPAEDEMELDHGRFEDAEEDEVVHEIRVDSPPSAPGYEKEGGGHKKME